MAADQDSKSRKQHDLEETPRVKARRLVNGDMQKLTDRFARLRARLYHHGRYLSDEDKTELVAFIEEENKQTVVILSGVGAPREFGFTSEFLDVLDD